MGLVAPATYILGGVDTRSNPLNRPSDRALRCRNWIPDEAGFLRLRDGYEAVTQSVVTSAFIHSMADYKLWAGTRYQLFVHGTTLKRRAHSGGTVTTLGTLDSSSDCEFAFADNKVYIVNGTDQKFYDGTTLRDIGIRQPTASEGLAVGVSEGVREPTSAEGSAVTITPNSSGGNFGVTSSSGYQFYLVYFDTTTYDLGPARAVSTRQTVASGSANRFDFSVLPDLSGVNTNWVKLLARTSDGGSNASFCATGSGNACTAVSRTSNVITATSIGHSLSVGNVVALHSQVTDSPNTTSGPYWTLTGVFVVASVPDVDTFTVASSGPDASIGNGGFGGGVMTASRLETVANATTTKQITSTAAASDSAGLLVANVERGVAATSVGGSQPGYQFYFCLYNPTTGEMSNRRLIGSRIAPANRCNIKITGLPSLSSENTEWMKLIGRTGDGAEVPYAIADSALNLIYASNTQTSIIISQGLDGSQELPTRNDVPSGLVQMARVGDRMLARKADSPYIFFTPSEVDERSGVYVGKPQHSWPADNFETFPTAENTTCLAEYDQEGVVFTERDCAILTETLGLLTWRGPWNIGCIGPRAFIKTPRGAFWVTGDRQLAMVTAEGPAVISEEYEQGMLSRIGDSYKADTEISYLRRPGIDRLAIKCRDEDGNPFLVYHDFKLADGRSPLGQGYEAVYVGALASNFTLVHGRDASGNAHLYAGGSNGQIYKLDSTGQDAGTNFTAEYITLVNLGEERKSSPWTKWHGDSLVQVYWGQALNTTLAQMQSDVKKLNRSGVMGGDENFEYRVTRGSDRVDAPQYIRLVLTSHPTGSDPMALNEVPHLPVENYGRFYVAEVALADPRGH